MRRIVVTDSTADIPEGLIAKHNIKVLPVNVKLNGKTYRDNLDISREAFYKSFDRFTDMASGPVRYEDYGLEFLQLVSAYDEILVIHCSKHLSNTYATAQMVNNEFNKEGNCRVKIIDSGQCSMGLGMIVLAAAEAMEQGKSFDQVCFIAEKTRRDVKSYMAIPTLKYLKKNKKISGLKALFGATIGVKPVLEMNEGRMVIKSKLFGEQKNMILAMMDTIKKEVAGRPITLSIIYAGNRNLVENLREVFESTFECRKIYIARFSPSISLNTGPESYAVFFTVDR